MQQTPDWQEIQERYPVGTIVSAMVTEHRPFGIMLDIGHPIARGHIPVPDFVLTANFPLTRFTILPFPEIGSRVTGRVTGYTFDERVQVWFTTKV